TWWPRRCFRYARRCCSLPPFAHGPGAASPAQRASREKRQWKLASRRQEDRVIYCARYCRRSYMSIYDDNLRPLKLDDVKTYPLASRPSKVSLDDFANPIQPDSSLKDFLAGLPNILGVQSLREIAARMRRAREFQKPIIWGVGGHVIKTGLAPLVIDLMKRGFVTAIAANGSV